MLQYQAVAISVTDSLEEDSRVFCASSNAPESFKFVEEFVDHLDDVAVRVRDHNMERVAPLRRRMMRDYVQYSRRGDYWARRKAAKSLRIIEKHCNKLNVLSWCGSSYDLNVVSVGSSKPIVYRSDVRTRRRPNTVLKRSALFSILRDKYKKGKKPGRLHVTSPPPVRRSLGRVSQVWGCS